MTGPNGPTIISPDATGNVTGQITAKVTDNFIITTAATSTINMLFGSSTVDTVTGNLSAGADRGADGMYIEANAGTHFSQNTVSQLDCRNHVISRRSIIDGQQIV